MDQLPGFVIGFDVVGQEDLGRPLLDFVSLMLNQSGIPFYFHAGESDWQGQPTDINIIDAVLLGSKRIGHGYAILKHPEARRLAKQKDIALEICPFSNQVLDLVSDLRNHPSSRSYPRRLSNCCFQRRSVTFGESKESVSITTQRLWQWQLEIWT